MIPRERLARYLLLGTLAFAPLLLGGAHLGTQLALGALVLIALTIAGTRSGRSPRWGAAAAALLLAAVGSALQLVPLPLEVLRVLTPAGHAVWSFDPELRAAPISVAPVQTAGAIVLLLLYAAGAWAGAESFRQARHRRELYLGVSAAAAAVLLVAVGHLAAGLSRPFNLPRAAQTFPSTFVNPNHLAGFLAFSSFVALAAAAAGPRGPARVLLQGLSAACAVAMVATLSRGAILAWGIAWLITLALLALRRRGERSASGGALAAVALGAVGAVLLLARAQDALLELTDARGVRKTELWAGFFSMAPDFPWVGMGRGAFAQVSRRYLPATQHATFTHLENEWLQALLDWGWPWAALVLLGLAFAWTRAARRVHDEPGGVYALAALAVLAVHNAIDFSAEVAGVGLPAMIMLGALEGRVRVFGRWSGSRVGSSLAIGASALAATFAGAQALRFDLEAETAAFARALRSEGTDGARVEMLRHHPADYLMPMLEGEARLRRGQPHEALLWANRALYLAPFVPEPQELVGRCLVRLRHVEQGVVALRGAIGSDARRARRLANWLLATLESAGPVVKLANDDPGVRRAIAQTLNARREDSAALEVIEPAGQPATDPASLELAAGIHLALGRHDVARARAERAAQIAPTRERPYRILADIEIDRGQGEQALRDLRRGDERTAGVWSLRYAEAAVLFRMGRGAEARTRAREVLGQATAVADQAKAHGLLAQICITEDRRPEALEHLAEARRLEPLEPRWIEREIDVRLAMADVSGAERLFAQNLATLKATPGFEALTARVAGARAARTGGVQAASVSPSSSSTYPER